MPTPGPTSGIEGGEFALGPFVGAFCGALFVLLITCWFPTRFGVGLGGDWGDSTSIS